MAKQTFTTGQVLTAAQMTSLQQTAMLGGNTTPKTTSYVLVAADAGDVVAMNSSSPTTITVNTSLFSAGDIVTIQNRGTGVCTITAGTATVNTSGSLVLAQHQGGILYFNSASAAVFYQWATPASGDIEGITTGANSGLTGGVTSGTANLKLNFASKGQLAVGTGSGTTGFLTVGTNGHTLVADSAETTGVKWATPSAALTVASIASGSMSGSTLTVSSLTNYDVLYIRFSDFSTSADAQPIFRLNGSSSTVYDYVFTGGINYSSFNNSAFVRNASNSDTSFALQGATLSASSTEGQAFIILTNCKNSGFTTYQSISYGQRNDSGTNRVLTAACSGIFKSAAGISSISITTTAGTATFDAGTYEVWGA